MPETWRKVTDNGNVGSGAGRLSRREFNLTAPSRAVVGDGDHVRHQANGASRQSSKVPLSLNPGRAPGVVGDGRCLMPLIQLDRGRTAAPASLGGVGPCRRLADLDQVTVGVADVGADFPGMLLGLG
jgi:hypothetical protein